MDETKMKDMFEKFVSFMKDTEEKQVEEAEIDKMVEKVAEKFASKLEGMKEEALKDIKNKAVDANKGLDLNGKKIEDLSKEEKISEFFKALVNKNDVMVKALSEGTDSQGGYLVPDEFNANIVTWQRDNPVLRRFVTTWPMKYRTLELPALAADVTVYWGSENTSISTTSIDFGTVQLTAKKLNALIYISQELFEDSAIEITNFLTERFAGAVSDEEDRVIIAGNGSTQPTGIASASIGSIAGGNAEKVDLLNSTYWRLPKKHRQNGSWIISAANLETLSAKKDNNGQYLIKSPTTDGDVPKLHGRPVIECDHVGNTIYFGDLRFYYLGDRKQMSVKITTEGAGTFEKDQVAIKVTERIDGKVALNRAFRKITAWR